MTSPSSFSAGSSRILSTLTLDTSACFGAVGVVRLRRGTRENVEVDPMAEREMALRTRGRSDCILWDL